MTKKQALTKIKEMAKDHNKTLLKECERLLNCGGADVEGSDNTYLLPKAILHVAILNQAFQYSPLSDKSREHVKNLKKF